MALYVCMYAQTLLLFETVGKKKHLSCESNRITLLFHI